MADESVRRDAAADALETQALADEKMQAFVQVARHGSFTRAAADLHLTQSAASALVKALEEQLGVLVLDRTTRRVVLTRAGEEFLARAERILAEVANAVSDTHDLVNKRRGLVSIAASPLSSSTFLPAAVAAFLEQYPNVRVQLHDILTEGIVEEVRSGAAELGIGTFQQTLGDVDFVTLFTDRLGVVLLSSSPLARKRRLSWRQIASQPRVSLSPSSAFRPLVDNIFATMDIAVARPRFEVGYMGTAVALVEAGLGISVLPERAAWLIRSPAVCWRPLSEPVVVHPSTLVTRSGRSLSPGARAFVDFLSTHLASQARAFRRRAEAQKRTDAPKLRRARTAE